MEPKNEDDPNWDMAHLDEDTCVKMGRDYLKAWYIFEAEVSKIQPRFEKLVE